MAWRWSPCAPCCGVCEWCFDLQFPSEQSEIEESKLLVTLDGIKYHRLRRPVYEWRSAGYSASIPVDQDADFDPVSQLEDDHELYHQITITRVPGGTVLNPVAGFCHTHLFRKDWTVPHPNGRAHDIFDAVADQLVATGDWTRLDGVRRFNNLWHGGPLGHVLYTGDLPPFNTRPIFHLGITDPDDYIWNYSLAIEAFIEPKKIKPTGQDNPFLCDVRFRCIESMPHVQARNVFDPPAGFPSGDYAGAWFSNLRGDGRQLWGTVADSVICSKDDASRPAMPMTSGGGLTRLTFDDGWSADTERFGVFQSACADLESRLEAGGRVIAFRTPEDRPPATWELKPEVPDEIAIALQAP